MSDIVIRSENLSKRYHIGERERYVALRDVLTRALKSPARIFRPQVRNGNGRNGRNEHVWALKNVSFEIGQGEVVGIIGRNGAGKTTLLKLLARITRPTGGFAEVRGRMGSLLEVGTGFHPELTGRDNVFLSGAILGMSKSEIRSKFDEIVAFAEVEKFIDMPLKHYSSGMQLRLAFAVAAHLEPEILLVDEVLAVGDAKFQEKCLGKMAYVAKEGRTVLFVSHNMQAVRQLCGRTILLADGGKALEGKSSQVIESYLRKVRASRTVAEVNRIISQLPPDPAFHLDYVDIVQDEQSGLEVVSGKPLEIVVRYDIFQEVSGLHVYFLLYDLEGTLLFESLHNGDVDGIPTVSPGRYLSRATIPADFLANRSYELHINVGIHRVRTCIPQPSPVRFPLRVTGVGQVNRAYPGYSTPGKLAPLIPWTTRWVATEEAAESERTSRLVSRADL